MRAKQQTITDEEVLEKYKKLFTLNKYRALGYLEGLLDGQELMEVLSDLAPQQLQRVKDFVAGLKGREVS